MNLEELRNVDAIFTVNVSDWQFDYLLTYTSLIQHCWFLWTCLFIIEVWNVVGDDRLVWELAAPLGIIWHWWGEIRQTMRATALLGMSGLGLVFWILLFTGKDETGLFIRNQWAENGGLLVKKWGPAISWKFNHSFPSDSLMLKDDADSVLLTVLNPIWQSELIWISVYSNSNFPDWVLVSAFVWFWIWHKGYLFLDLRCGLVLDA